MSWRRSRPESAGEDGSAAPQAGHGSGTARESRTDPSRALVGGRTIALMTREQAEARAAELNRDHPDRATHRWLARESGDAWEVARVALPAGVRLDPFTATTEARPRPPQAPDPRPAFIRDVGGPYGV